jgi:hypothetical protein
MTTKKRKGSCTLKRENSLGIQERVYLLAPTPKEWAIITPGDLEGERKRVRASVGDGCSHSSIGSRDGSCLPTVVFWNPKETAQ